MSSYRVCVYCDVVCVSKERKKENKYKKISKIFNNLRYDTNEDTMTNGALVLRIIWISATLSANLR